MKCQLQDQIWCQEILKAIVSANTTLRARNVRLTIYAIDNWIHLRGQFPPKPYSKKRTSHQQSLALEYHMSNEAISQSIRNIKQAYRSAEYIYGLILRNEFDWRNYMRHQKKFNEFVEAQEKMEQERNKKVTFLEVFNKFEEDFFKYGKSKFKDDRWTVLESHLSYLKLDEDFSLKLLESKFLEFIEQGKTEAAMRKAQQAAKQFLIFVTREGFDQGEKNV